MATRTFMALSINDEIRKGLLEARRQLDADLAGDRSIRINWVAPENLHVTLRFLGDVSDGVLPRVLSIASEVAMQTQSFEFPVRRVACVPPAGPVRMLWARVGDPAGRMAELHDELSAALAPLGLTGDGRSFKPHLTLARVKSTRSAGHIRKAVAQLPREEFGSADCVELAVFASELTPTGPVYTPLVTPKLGL